MKFLLLLVILIPVASCNFFSKDDKEAAAPTIDRFVADPISVSKGESVTLSLYGTGLSECKLYANDQELDGTLTIKETITHIPVSQITTYKAICFGPGGVAEAEPQQVNIILNDKKVEADSLLDIGEYFDVQALVEVVLSGNIGPLTDYDPESRLELETPPVAVLSQEAKSEVTFNQENSLIYGFQTNLKGIQSKGDQACQAKFSLTKGLTVADFKHEKPPVQRQVSTKNKEFIKPGVHIRNFSAVTKAPEGAIPVGTPWNVTFSIAYTSVDYTETSEVFPIALGSFDFKSGSDPYFYKRGLNPIDPKRPDEPPVNMNFAGAKDLMAKIISSTQRQDAAADKKDLQMAEQCLANKNCKTFVMALNSVNQSSLIVASLESHLNSIEILLDSYKDAGRSFIIPEDDKWFSRLANLRSIVRLFRIGWKPMVKTYIRSGGSWSNGLNILLGKTQLPPEFETPEKSELSIKKLIKLVGRMESIAPIQISRYSCDWTSTGAFKVYKEPTINKIKKKSLNNKFQLSMKNINPVTQSN